LCFLGLVERDDDENKLTAGKMVKNKFFMQKIEQNYRFSLWNIYFKTFFFQR